MKDRGGVRGALWRGPPIEPGIEDGFDRAIGPGADLDGALGSGLDARGAERADETHDAETGAAALLGMWPAFQDLLAKRRGRRADLAGRLPGCARSSSRRSACDWTACARERSCASGSACAQMNGDALALMENLDAAGGQPRLDLGAGEAARGQNNSGRRCRRDSRRRPGARATRCIRKARWAAP